MNFFPWKLSRLKEGKINKVLKDCESYTIAELRSNERCYLVKDFPSLSPQEEEIAKRVFEEFLESKKSKKVLDLKKILENYCEKNFLELDFEQQDYILFALKSFSSGFGVLDNFLSNQNIEEIAVIGTGLQKPVFVYEKNFGWLKTNAFYLNEQEVINLANKMSTQIGRHLSMQTPFINAFLPDGSRLNACIPPMALEPTLTVRKFREEPFTPLDLINNKTITAEASAFLWLAMQTDSSVIISGNTGSGKTTTLNALFSFVPKSERIVLTEETPEIVLPHKHVCRLKTVDNIGVTMNDLITNTLRMRPDRVIVGEVRNSLEVKAFVNTLLAGQGKGAIGTFHAKSAKETISRLSKMDVEKHDLGSIDLIVVQKRWDKINLQKKTRIETRRVTEISEVTEKNGEIILSPVFEFDYKKNRLCKVNESQRVIEKICNCFGFSKKNAEKEILKRAQFLEGLCIKKIGMREFFEVINNGLE